MSDSVSKLLIEKCGVPFFLVVILALAIIAILHFGVKFDINAFLRAVKYDTESWHRPTVRTWILSLVAIIAFKLNRSFTRRSERRTGFALDAEPYCPTSPIKRN